MFPPVYRTLRANTTVLNTVGTRIGRQGEVPQDTARPYITWFLIATAPHDQISGPPPSDFIPTHLDCWHPTDAGAEALASAVRDSLDAAGVHNRLIINLRDPVTRLYRVGIEADFITQR